MTTAQRRPRKRSREQAAANATPARPFIASRPHRGSAVAVAQPSDRVDAIRWTLGADVLKSGGLARVRLRNPLPPTSKRANRWGPWPPPPVPGGWSASVQPRRSADRRLPTTIRCTYASSGFGDSRKSRRLNSADFTVHPLSDVTYAQSVSRTTGWQLALAVARLRWGVPLDASTPHGNGAGSEGPAPGTPEGAGSAEGQLATNVP